MKTFILTDMGRVSTVTRDRLGGMHMEIQAYDSAWPPAG